MTTLYSTLAHCFPALLCMFLWYCPAAAQPGHEANTLLWEISGNGLSRPSYLYGTMHIQDKRVFHFNDSVLVKLRECSAFAMELHPDSMMQVVFSIMFQPDTSGQLRKATSTEEYDRLAEELQQRSGLDIENINTSNPWVLESFLDTTSSLFSKDKPTFLDGYLYHLARRYRKQIFALEIPEEQLGSFDADSYESQIRKILEELNADPATPAMVDEFINLYSSGNLAAINEMTQSGQDTTELRTLLQRNHTMVRRLLPLMQEHGVFVAVGAAHLPGNEGLIDLLRRKGYTVTPVRATFDSPSELPADVALDIPWYTLRTDTAFYSVDFPAKPLVFPMNFRESVLTDMTIYPDLGTGITYFAALTTLPIAVAEDRLDSFFEKFGTGMAEEKDGTIVLDSSISYNGIRGQEVHMLIGRARMRMRVFLRRNIMYMFFAHTAAGVSDTADINRFFSSVQFAPMPEQVQGEQQFASEKDAFSILLPETPVVQTTRTENGAASYTTTLYSATDGETEITYLISAFLYEPGQSLQKNPFAAVAATIAENLGGAVTEGRDTVWENCPMYLCDISDDDRTIAHSRLVMRGSRIYMLLALTEEKDLSDYADNVSHICNSLHFTDFKPAEWSTFSAAVDAFHVLFPTEPIVERDTGLNITTTYTAQDPHSGTSYVVNITDYNPYFQSDSEEAFFDAEQEEYTTFGDTVYASNRLTVGGYPAFEMEKAHTDAPNVYRIRAVLRYNRLYTLLVHAPREWLRTPVIDNFFTSLTLLPADSTGSIYTRKTPRLAADLLSADSTIRSRASQALRFTTFHTDDLPLLYNVLRHPFPDDDQSYRGVRASILREMRDVYDSTTVPFLQELYPTLHDTLELRDVVLQNLACYNTEQSLNTMADLLTTLPRNDTLEHYSVFDFISTTTSTCRVMFPRILSITESEGYRDSFYTFLVRALDSNIITAAHIAGIREQFYTYGYSTFKKREDVPEDDSTWQRHFLGYDLQTVARLLGYYADSASVSLLHTLAADADSALALEALYALEQCNHSPAPSAWEGYAASLTWRNTLYRKLDGLHKLDRFPERYRTQEALAEGNFIEFLMNDEEEPSDFRLIQVHEVAEGPQQGRYYVYKFCYTDGDEDGAEPTWYVGISGPQPMDKEKMVANGVLTMSHFNTVDEMSIEEHIATLLDETAP